MPRPMVRGSIIISSVAFADKLLGTANRPSLRDQASPSLKATLPLLAPGEWYPREHWVEILRAIVSVNDDPVRSAKDLEACGRAICEDAANTVIKLLLKIMTPRVFAKKFPDLWARDMQGGQMSVDSSEIQRNRVRVHLRDVEGFDHVGPVGVGFIGFSMDRITGRRVDVTVVGWSPAVPGPPEVRWDVAW